MMKTTLHIQANLFWLYTQDKESQMWVAHCPPLKIVAEGKTYSELMEAMDDCIQTLFTDLWEAGELGNFLREHNWRALTPIPQRRTAGNVRFDVPYEIQQRPARNFETVCH
jgi:predicted RNase H-like HicB family nuclease